MMTIGERILLLRKRNRETQKALAYAIKVVPSAVSHWEADRQDPSIYAIREICKHYGVSADWLLGLKEGRDK